jgi:protein ImuA
MAERSHRAVGLDELRQQIARLEGARRCGRNDVLSSGSAAIDGLLPAHGFRRGTLVEWLAGGDGTGVGTLALLAAREACRTGRMLVVLDERRDFCPPAAVRLGIDSRRLMVVHAESVADADWAMDQVLRSPTIGAVLAWPDGRSQRTFRRWQLAIEAGGGLGLLLRPETARADPSWADVRLWVESRCATATDKRLLRIALLHCRGGTDGRHVDVELDDETYRVHSTVREPRPSMGRALRAV